MKTEDLTDQRLIKLGLTDALCARFGAKEFAVERRSPGGATDYVESIDTSDGDTTWTTDPQQARIFRGEEWARIWARPGFWLIVPDGLPTAK